MAGGGFPAFPSPQLRPFSPADINECLSAACEGLCVNTEGGFVCECGPGMQLAANRHSCQGLWGQGAGEGRSAGALSLSLCLTDTDECLATPCQHRCKNSMGSYRCSCRPGYHLHGNQHTCVGECWSRAWPPAATGCTTTAPHAPSPLPYVLAPRLPLKWWNPNPAMCPCCAQCHG